MHAAVSSGHQLPASPATYHVCTPSSGTSSAWRLPRSTVSSPEFSDSKEEEDMDIDQVENSPWTDSALQLSSTLLANHRSTTLFSLSDLHISEQKKLAQSCEKAVLLKRAHSLQLQSAGKIFRTCSNAAEYSFRALKNESDDSDCCLSDARWKSSPGDTRMERPALAPFNEVNNISQDHGTLKSASLPAGQPKLLFNAKCFLFSVSFLMIAVAVIISYVQQSPTTHCVDHIDIESLRYELQHRVHGQHIAVNIVAKRLEEFTSASDVRQLVMSFHGWTGIGKNFMSSIIAQHLPPTNVHKIIVPLHFARGLDNDGLLLSEWIVSNMTAPSCGLHLFIVDEIDKAASSLVSGLRETLSRLSMQSDTSCRAVFLLLTNDGATEINAAVTEVLMNGGCREDLDYVDLVPRLSSAWYTELASATLIDETVPFLPLERRHVAQCTETELKQRQVHVAQQLVDNVVNSLTYFPANVSLFSSSGCRRITHLVDLFL